MVLLPQEKCLEKSSSSIKGDKRLPETTHSDSECSNTVHSSYDHCESYEKCANTPCDELGSIDTSFFPNVELLIADVNTDSSPLTPGISCAIEKGTVVSGGPQNSSTAVEDECKVNSDKGSEQVGRVKIAAGGIPTKEVDMRRIPSPTLSGISNHSVDVEGSENALKVIVGGNHDMTNTHGRCSDEVMHSPKISENPTMRSLSSDSASDHVKSTTSSNSSNSSSSSKQSPRKSFATPLAPISPYKAFNENRMERERLARKEPIQMLKLPDSPKNNISSSVYSPEQRTLGDGEFQRPNSTSSISKNENSVSTSTLLLLVVVYISIFFASSWHLLPTPDYSNPVSQSPWIGENNATKLIDLRLNLIQERFQKVLVREDWKLLRMSPNVTIETMSSEDGSWPGYIRTCAIFQAKPAEILRHLGWLQFDETQKKVDRFHESAYLLFAPSHKSKVMRKVRKIA